jgi:chaperonin cofactor prefoldin
VATLDQGVHNLDELISTLVDATGRLQAHNASLESLDEALHGFADTVSAAFEDIAERLQSSIDALEDATSDLESELQELTGALRSAAEERLDAAGGRADTAGTELTQELQDTRTGLTTAFAALDESGFQVLGAAVQAVMDGTVALSGQMTQAFADLGQSLQDQQAQLGQEREQGEQSLQEAAGGLRGADHDTLQSASEESIAGWSREVPAAIEGQAAAFGPDIEAVYDAFQQEAGTAADAIMAGVDAALREAQEEGSAQAAQLQGTVEATALEAVVPLDEEEGRLEATLAAGALLSDTLESMQADLDVTPRLVAEIDRLLQAVE